MKKVLFLSIAVIAAISMRAAEHYTYTTGTGNPGSVNTELDNVTSGWNLVTFSGTGSAGTSSNQWSDAVVLPADFTFLYMDGVRTQFQASKNGCLNFWPSGINPTMNLPGDNVVTPPASPRNLVAVFWDKFTTTTPLGADDNIYYKIFGAKPNRQIWIKWNSFAMNTSSSANFACVLEETTCKVYMVDYKTTAGGNLLTCSTGIWDSDKGDMVAGSPNLTLGTGGSTSTTDNTYYVFDPLPPYAPGAPTITLAADGCGPILNQPFNNNPYIRYYWQGTSCGTLLSNSNATYAPTANGTYYLRTYNLVNGKWSTTCSSTDIIDFKPRAPQPEFSVSNNTCGNKTLYLESDVSGYFNYEGDDWYEQAAWQGTTCGEDVLLDATSNNYSVSSSGTYFLRSYWVYHDMSDVYNCWSSCASAAVIVNPIPTTPPIPDVSTNACGNKVLTRAAPGAGITYYWQTTAAGTSTANSSLTYTATTSGTYYLRAQTTAGCWSSSSASVTVTVNPIPADPALPVASSNICGDKTITRSDPPASTTYFWQSNPSGVAITSSDKTLTTSISSSFYLRARTTAGCWSANSSSISVTVYSIPAAPVAPTLSTNKCGSKTLSHAVPPGGVTYFWQTAADGESTANSATDNIISSTGTHYLRARSIDGCWSTSSQLKFVQINELPAPPPIPTADPSACGKVTIRHAKAPAGLYYYWQSSASTQEMTDSSSTKEVFVSGNYYLKSVSDSSCWSYASFLGVNVYAVPDAPLAPSVSTNACGDKTLTRDNPPFNITYFWQDSASGTKVTDLSKNKVVSQTGSYYLRAQSNDGGCWSASSAVVSATVLKPYDKERICLVTLDSATKKNRIIWERTAGKKTVSYKIYKFVSPSYTVIGTKLFDSLSVFIDAVSNPESEPFRYAISVVDSCGAESALSPAHQTMKLWSNVSTEKNAANINWYRYIDESGDFVPDSFYIYKGKTKNNMTLIAAQPATNKEIQIYTDYNFKEAVAYYQVGIKKPVACSPAILKAESGPYTQSLSNIIEYKTTGLSIYQEIPVSVYPNPFFESLTVELSLEKSSDLIIEVINGLGQKTAEFVYKNRIAGTQEFQLNSSEMNIMSGICYLKIFAAEKMTVIKVFKTR